MHNVETWVFPLLIVLVGLTMLGRYLHGERESRRRPGGLTRFSDNVTSEGKPDFATHLSTTGLTPLETFSPASAYVGSSIFWERIDDPGFVGQAFRTRPTLRYVLRSVDAAAVAHLRWG